MNKYVNQPCNSSVATSCTKFEWLILRVEWPLFSLRVCQVQRRGNWRLMKLHRLCLAPNVHVAPGVSAAVEEGEECVGAFSSPVAGEESAARHLEEADDNDSFINILSGITAIDDAASEGWTFGEALARADLSVETLAEGVVDTSRLPTRESSFFISH